MAFTREFIRSKSKESGVEIPKELEDALVSEHLSARDTYAETQVNNYKKDHPEGQTPNVKDSQEYKDLKKEFEDYKRDQDAAKTKDAKVTAYTALLKAANVPEKRIPAIIKLTDLDAMELDDKGGLKDSDKLTEDIKTEWAGVIPTTTVEGLKTETPPENNPRAGKDPGEMSMEDYINYRSKGE